MPTLRYYCLIYTDGRAPRAPDLAESDFRIEPLAEVPRISPDTDLFGPHAQAAERGIATARAAFLFQGQRDVVRDAGAFFGVANGVLARAVEGLEGWAIDVLKLWPFPLAEASDLPEDPLAEDLFSIGFYERDPETYRAETYGICKLGQREVAFGFKGKRLIDEAALMCAHLADYAMGQARRVGHGQTMSFGFDRLSFAAAEGGEAGGALRGWHATFVQRVLGPELFPGVGLLEVGTFTPMTNRATADLSEALGRSFEQRQVLEGLELAGESPHQGTSVKSCACAGTAGLRGFRDEPESVKDSGWTFLCTTSHSFADIGVGPLGHLAHKLPQIVKYLALPPGCSVDWSEKGEVSIDPGDAAALGDEDEGD